MTKVCHTFLLIVAVNNGTLSIEALIKLSACYARKKSNGRGIGE